MTRHHSWEDLVNHTGSKVLQLGCFDKCGDVRVDIESTVLFMLLHVAVLIYLRSETDCRVAMLLSRTRYSSTASGCRDKRWEEFMLKWDPSDGKRALAAASISDENISRRFSEAPLALPCEGLWSDRKHVKVVETCAPSAGG